MCPQNFAQNSNAYPVAAASKAYAVNGLNQYTAVAGTTHSYDANGNLTGDGINSYGYDAENRLISATTATQTVTLAYDPMGRLNAVTGSTSGTTRLLYDGDELIREYDGAGTVRSTFVHGIGVDDPMVDYGPSGRRFLHKDHQGSIIALSDNAGNAVAINRYDEYGIPAATNVGRFGYTGQIWIAELGLWYYKARFYSPQIGRFLQVDPIGYDDQINLYAYVANDPVTNVDPSGEAIQVSRSGNNVLIRFKIAYYGVGNSKAVRQKFNEGILRTWAGNKGRFNVSVNVQSFTFKPGTSPSTKTINSLPEVNFVDITKGGEGEKARVVDDRFGVWPADRPGSTAGHESGHFGDLPDMYNESGPLPGYEGTLMGESGGKVTEKVIEDLLRATEEEEARRTRRPPPPKPE